MKWSADVHSTVIHSLDPSWVSRRHALPMSYNNICSIVVAKQEAPLVHIVYIFRLECMPQDPAEFLEVVFDVGRVARKSSLAV